MKRLRGVSDPVALLEEHVFFSDPTALFTTKAIVTAQTAWFSVNIVIACLFISLIASVPFILIRSKGKGCTKIGLIQSFALLAWLGGGIYLLMFQIHFQSTHFEGTRSLSLCESVYWMSQIITTVGYGDIIPAFGGGKLFVIAYVLSTILIISHMISDVVDIAMDYAEEVAKVAAEKSMKGSDEDGLTSKQQVHKWLQQDKPPLPWMPLIGSICVYLAFVIAGVLFFTLTPGEGKSVLEGVYMSVITLSTVGFGAVTPSTESGQVFCAFWMLFGVASLVGAVQVFSSFMRAVKDREDFSEGDRQRDFSALLDSVQTDGQGRIDKYEFMKICLLNSRSLNVSADELKKIEYAYRDLDPDPAGLVPLAEIKKGASESY